MWTRGKTDFQPQTLPLINCVVLGKLINFSGPSFPPQENESNGHLEVLWKLE